MKVNTKRKIYLSLCVLFIGYTFCVDTVGTATDLGEHWLTPAAMEGKLVFQKYNCTSCHQLYGLGGYMGPDLTNVISEKGKGNDYVNAFLENGTTRMPNFHMSSYERKELIAFLCYVDKTGQSPSMGAEIRFNGSLILPNEK